MEDVVVVNVWQLYLQLSMQSVSITTDDGFDSRSGRGAQHYVIKLVSNLQ